MASRASVYICKIQDAEAQGGSGQLCLWLTSPSQEVVITHHLVLKDFFGSMARFLKTGLPRFLGLGSSPRGPVAQTVPRRASAGPTSAQGATPRIPQAGHALAGAKRKSLHRHGGEMWVG